MIGAQHALIVLEQVLVCLLGFGVAVLVFDGACQPAADLQAFLVVFAEDPLLVGKKVTNIRSASA
jgi:hypothetical protein